MAAPSSPPPPPPPPPSPPPPPHHRRRCCAGRPRRPRRPPDVVCLEQEVGAWDAVHLEPLSEDAFAANLHQRFKRDQIYTYVGNVLVSVNPYKNLALYSCDVVEAYRCRGLLELPPHIFAVADTACRWLRDRNEDQCVVLSGESGAGKTEAARLLLQYVALASSSTSTAPPGLQGAAVAPPPPAAATPPPAPAPAPAPTSSSNTSSSGSSSAPLGSGSPHPAPHHHHLLHHHATLHHQHHHHLHHQATSLHHHLSAPHLPAAAAASSSSSSATPRNARQVIKDRLLQAGPLLEAFGNAKTYRNDNSSRFGKCLDVEFDFKGEPLGGTVTNYLLEKSRVTKQAQGERNFHIFYQLLTGADIQLLKSLKLQRNVDNYAFLHSSRALQLETVDDRRDFQVTKKALETLGFTLEEVINVFQIVACVLKLGNIVFIPTNNIDGTEGCTISNEYELYDVCHLLGTEFGELSGTLKQRTMSVVVGPTPPPSSGTKACSGDGERGSPHHHHHHPPPHLLSRAQGTGCDDSEREVYEVCEIVGADQGLVSSMLTSRRLGKECHHSLHSLSHHHVSGQTSQPQQLADTSLIADLSAVEATTSRDSLCKTLYSRLFTWLVNRVNEGTKVGWYGKRRILSLLDIYGFEMLEQNSFEQFIINFCNEKLQQVVSEWTLREEQEEYVREGLEWKHVDFASSSAVCELIEKNNHGILSILDEECLRGAECLETGTQVVFPSLDEAFLARIAHAYAGHTHFEAAPQHHRNFVKSENRSTLPYNCFRLKHYAGTVTYNVSGFVDKNNDMIHRDISLAMYRCEHPLLKVLFPEGNPKRTTFKRPATAGTQFKVSMGALIKNLQSKNPHYIRCIKPNELKQPRIFEMALVLHQVRYLGLVETARIRRWGFCYRETYESFLQRYKMLSIHTWPCWRGAAAEGVSYLLRTLPISASEFAFGRTKLFIRCPRTVFELEEFRKERLEDLATLLQKVWRGWRRRRQFLLMKHSQTVIASAWRSWRECHFGNYIKGKKNLWCLCRVAREEYRILKHRKQVEWAVNVIQKHYLSWKRRQFLLTLSCQLPSDSPISRDWPHSHQRRLADASLLLRRVHHKWRCHKYRLKFDQTARNRMREKVTASIIFKDRKASYPRSVSHPFLGDYVRLRQNVQWKKICVETNDQYVVFADIIHKITRSSGKFVPILFVLSTSSMLILDQRTLQVKYRVPAAEIYRLSLSPFLDDVAVFHVRASSPANEAMSSQNIPGCLFQSDMGKKKGDFVFQTGHVIEIVTKLFLVVQNAMGKPPEVNISTEFEANFGQQTVLFSFKCMGLPEVQPGQIKIFRKGNKMEVLV
ncbi:unconventional myosin-Ia-like [Hetaerina americana]|uniref:unconventional myosin-Ia-like n=1 Tax=Hetaerina americana TaxID=62018 RepID=UPI003A7F5215